MLRILNLFQHNSFLFVIIGDGISTALYDFRIRERAWEVNR